MITARLRITPAILVLTLILFALVPNSAHAHDDPGGEIQGPPGHDKPGPPPILTTVTLVWIDYPYQLDQDDWGADIEMNVTSSVQHTGHGYGVKQTSDPDLNWNTTMGNWLLVEDVYSHRECTPMEPLTISLTGYEADASELDALEKKLLNAVIQLARTDKFLLPSSTLARLIGKIFAFLNPDDYLGFGSVVAPGPGSYEVTTSGGDYVISGLYWVGAPVQTGGECDPDSVPSYNVPPPYCYYSTAFFDSLTQSFWDVDGVVVEAGASGEVTPQDLDDAKTGLRSAMVGMTQWVSAQMLEDAQGLAGFSSAYYYYVQGTQDPAPASIDDFRQAFCAAEYAILSNFPDPFAPEMAPTAAAVPSFIATRAGRPAEYLIGVFGAGSDSIGIAGVSGGPPGATFSLTPADPDHPSWRLLRVTESGPPGTYAINVSFTAPSVPSLSLTLDLDEPAATTDVGPKPGRPAPQAFVLHGVRPNPLTTKGTLRVDLPTRAALSLAIFDVSGRRVQGIATGQTFGAGSHLFFLDGGALAPGVYHVRLEARPVEQGWEPFEAVTKLVVSH